nr:ribonuclease H-like domain, reverse transcriptase, RNA-dependent DNA polymerase [Tanacetum cinerariifolium]
QEVKKDVSSLRYIALPNWAYDALLEFSLNQPQDHCCTEVPEGSGNFNPAAPTSNPLANQMETLTVETPIPTVSSPVPSAYSTDSQEPSNDARLISKRVANQAEIPSLDNILSLTNWFADILRDTTNSDESNGEEADISNIETAIIASPTPTLRIHKDHPKSQIIGPVDTPIQTRNKSKEASGSGHTQEEGIDYDEVFAPVARIEAIRLFLAYASFTGFVVYQMDVKSAFLYGTIDEEVYMMQPSGFQDPKFPTKVYKVEKAMYGLHQAPRAWYVYVDDIIFGSSNPQLCREFEALMHEKFQMSAMGELNFFLGLQVLQKEDGIFLSQDKYVEDILKKFRYSDVRSSNTPMDKENHWGKEGTGKDTIMATSTTEAEYVAAASCCGQVLWIQNQLLEYV